MESMKNKYTVYHGTDVSVCDDIINRGFKPNSNEKHWLGQGVYFFLTKNEAKSWTKKKTCFGNSNIKNPAVLKAIVECNYDSILDTRKYIHYKSLVKYYEEFQNQLFSKDGKCIISVEIDSELLRCLFFDWVAQSKNISVFIAGFEKQTFSKENSNDIAYDFQIPFIEYQMCVNDISLINNVVRVE